MVEILFHENDLNCLRHAIYAGRGAISSASTSVVYAVLDDDQPPQQRPARGNVAAVTTDVVYASPDPELIAAAQREAEERRRRAWEAATPMEVAPEDLYALDLFLSAGSLEGDLLESRKRVFRALSVFPGPTNLSQIVDRAGVHIQGLLSRLSKHEDARLWYHHQPHEATALRWLCRQLADMDYRGTLHMVSLPPWIPATDGDTVTTLRSWGELDPGQWAGQLHRQEVFPAVLIPALAREWDGLVRENAPLRAMVDGKLHSVSEDFYDPFLGRAIRAQPDQFHQARVIGDVIIAHPAVSDGWLYQRMERMIEAGRLEAVTQPEGDDLLYRRILRKVAGRW